MRCLNIEDSDSKTRKNTDFVGMKGDNFKKGKPLIKRQGKIFLTTKVGKDSVRYTCFFQFGDRVVNQGFMCKYVTFYLSYECRVESSAI